MGRRAQKTKKTVKRGVRHQRKNDPAFRQNKPGRRPAPKSADAVASEVLWFTLNHYFPEFVSWLKEIPDPRKRHDKTTFPVEFLILMALVMMCGQCGSRRQLDHDRQGEEFGANLWRFLGLSCCETACSETMNNVVKAISPDHFEKLIAKLAAALHRSKALHNFLHDGKLVVAVDGTQMLSFHERHCEHCQTREHADGKIQFFHYVIAAKIVTSIGLVIPFAFEFCENPAGMSQFDKQDCEIKASRRLFKKIRTLFPRLKIMLVGDGLYADETTFSLCNQHGWDFMITLKPGKIRSVDKQIPRNFEAWDGCRTVYWTPPGKKRMKWVVRWKTPVKYRNEVLHVISFEEFDSEGQRLYHNTWITNVKPDNSNALGLAQAGRLRWKIENEGTNTQKNGGYEMEHGYGLGGHAWKNYYLIMQVGQLFNDLVKHGDLLQKLAKDKKASFARLYGSMGNFARRLIEALRNTPPLLKPPPWGERTIQIRFAKTG